MLKIFGQTLSKALIGRSTVFLSKNYGQCAQNVQNKRTCKKPSPYVILKPNPQDFKRILRFMHRYYYPEEPSCKALSINCNKYLDDWMHNTLSEGVSLIAKCKHTGRILAVAINQTTKPWDHLLKEKESRTACCPRLKTLLKFYSDVQRGANVYKTYDVKEVFELSNLAVVTQERGKGLGYLLIQSSIQSAKEKGYRLFRIDCTNHFSALICDTLHLNPIYRIKYTEYKDAQNQQIFKTDWPHTHCTVYIKQIEQLPKCSEYAPCYRIKC